MANVRKRILQLTPLPSASLDTTIVGVDNGVTYRIELDVLADAVTSRVNILDRDRLNSLESSTGSYLTSLNGAISSSSQLTSSYDTRYVVSGSITQTTWDNIASKPNGIISSSTQIEFVTIPQMSEVVKQQLDINYVVSGSEQIIEILSPLNEFTSSQSTLNTAFTNGINSRLQTSSFNQYTASQSTSSLVDRLNAIENVSGSWITESETGSYLTSLNGAISSSSQVIGILSPLNSVSASLISKTGSYATTGSNTFYGDQIFIGNVLTQSVELIAGEYYGGGIVFKVVSGSYALIVDVNDLGAAQAQYMQVATNATSTTGSVNQSLILARSGSTPNAVADVNNPARSNYGLDMEDPAIMAYSSSVGGYTDWYIPSTTEIVWINQGVPGRIYEGFSVANRYWTSNYADSPYTYYVSDGVGRTSRILGEGSNGGSTQHPVVAIRKINRSYREVYGNANIIISGSINVSGSITGSTNFNTIVNKPTLISSSAQITAFGFISSSHTDITSLNSFTSSQSTLNTAFNNGISARLQTSSFNDYTASANSRITTLEGTIISGSVNYTQVLGNKRTNITTIGVSLISGSITTTGNPVQIMVTGDANPTSTGWCRLQLYRGESAIGNIVQVENESNQNVPYCLNIIDTPSSGTHIYSMRTVSGIAGTFEFGEASGPLLTAVELRTNTNLPSTNNTFTGNNTFRGITTFATVGGDEGGEVEFGVPQTNTTLSTRVVADVFRNTFRIYDGNTNGVYIDLSKAPTGANGELMHKASGFVNRGVDVTLGNLKARVAATGNASLQLSTVSGTYSIYGSGTYSQAGAIAGATLSTTLSITTTPTYIVAGYNFGVAGAVDTWNITDVNLGITWRITMIIGFGYNNNFISIERLH